MDKSEEPLHDVHHHFNPYKQNTLVAIPTVKDRAQPVTCCQCCPTVCIFSFSTFQPQSTRQHPDSNPHLKRQSKPVICCQCCLTVVYFHFLHFSPDSTRQHPDGHPTYRDRAPPVICSPYRHIIWPNHRDHCGSGRYWSLCSFENSEKPTYTYRFLRK